jgi:hypothetical protein
VGVPNQSAFIIEDWQHVGNRPDGNGSAAQYFILKVSGPTGRWPLRSYILGPGVVDDTECAPLEKEVDLEATGQAFIEIECAVEDPEPGVYTMRLYIEDQVVGSLSFRVSDGA